MSEARSIAVVQFVCSVLAGVMFGWEFGWHIGVGVFALAEALSPVVKGWS